VLWSPEVFSAPDTGNIEVLWHYGTPEQQDRWLRPLMEGRIRPPSMTEPAVASSDATNIQCDIRRDGEHYVIDGRKVVYLGCKERGLHCRLLMGSMHTGPPLGDTGPHLPHTTNFEVFRTH